METLQLAVTRRTRPRLAAFSIALSAVLAATLLPAASADAAGTPSGPQYTYRMVSVSKIASRVKSEALSTVACVQRSGSVSYAISSTRSNTFSYTAGLSVDILKSLLSATGSVSGSVSTSTTVTETLTMNLSAGECAQVFALRDKYRYTLQKKCNYACSGVYYNKTYVTLGTGTYSKFVGRKYYLV